MNNCPLTGKPCFKKQYYQVTDINEEKVKTITLCEDCIVNYTQGKAPETIESGKPDLFKTVIELLGHVLSNPGLTSKSFEGHKIKNKECSSCKHTLLDVSESAKLGCPQCYESFEKELLPIILHVQNGSTQHVGKVPKNQAKNQAKDIPEMSIQEYISSLKEKMTAAISKENYEEAAVMRDRLIAYKALFSRLEESINNEDFEQANLIRREMQKFMDSD